jgi:hypothetical protein
MRTFPLLALFAASAFGLSAATITISDFSAFTPTVFGGTWDEDSSLSGATTFAVGNFSGTQPTFGNFEVTFAAVDWTGYQYVTLTGFAAAGLDANLMEGLAFYFTDASDHTSSTPFTLTDFGAGPSSIASTAMIDATGVDLTQVVNWGIGTNFSFDAFAFTFDNLSLSTTAIPEPSTYATLCGAFGLVGALALRRRRLAV